MLNMATSIESMRCTLNILVKKKRNNNKTNEMSIKFKKKKKLHRVTLHLLVGFFTQV